MSNPSHNVMGSEYPSHLLLDVIVSTQCPTCRQFPSNCRSAVCYRVALPKGDGSYSWHFYRLSLPKSPSFSPVPGSRPYCANRSAHTRRHFSRHVLSGKSHHLPAVICMVRLIAGYSRCCHPDLRPWANHLGPDKDTRTLLGYM